MRDGFLDGQTSTHGWWETLFSFRTTTDSDDLSFSPLIVEQNTMRFPRVQKESNALTQSYLFIGAHFLFAKDRLCMITLAA